MQRVEARVSRTARAKEFTDHFLQAVDEDGDGELSLLELKMSSVRTKSTGGADAMYANTLDKNDFAIVFSPIKPLSVLCIGSLNKLLFSIFL